MIHLLEAETLKNWIAKNEVILIDVREQNEYNEGNIKGSTLIPLNTLTMAKVKEITTNGKKIAIHCKSGVRSLKACQMLMEYDNNLDVYNVEGGIISWNLINGTNTPSGILVDGKNSAGGCNS